MKKSITAVLTLLLLISVSISSCSKSQSESSKGDKAEVKTEVKEEVTLSGYMTDARCGESLDSDELAKIHSRECCLEVESQKSGYGVFSQGKFQKFDSTSTLRVKDFLRSIQKEEELKVQVKGQWVSNAFQVETISLL
ncbi:MAG: hypothetical protein SFU91_11890 [Chloroherpetonaceae bacterium]|nr:hypothetical protein [Chloroherpetonaceae bacterium]